MSKEEPEDKDHSQAGSSSEEPSSPEKDSPRRSAMTPELRRFLGPGRSRHDAPPTEEESEKMDPPKTVGKPTSEPPEAQEPEVTPTTTAEEESDEAEPEHRAPTPAAVMPDRKLWRATQMQSVALIIGALVLLMMTFYVGHKFAYWKHMIMSRSKPKLTGITSDKFPGSSAEELIEQALVAERLGNWNEAAGRLIAAKRKNLTYRGLLFRAGKICYDHADFDNADKLLERAIAFGEQVDTANYLRGLIAVGRNDLPAAQRFFEAAATAEPFTPGYYYYLGEALRRDHRPKEAVRRYEQAAARARSDQDAVVCRFKVRMARIEAAEGPQLNAEIEKLRASGPLSVDWLLTDAALQTRESDIAEAVQLIDEARVADERRLFSLFASCTTDMLFTEACRNHPELTKACRVAGTPAPPPMTP